jgi:DnaJ-class molecular chaperone
MKFQDYYDVLGLSRDADEAAIKKAYRKLAMKWHPDRHKDKDQDAAEAEFKRVSEAYEVLSDPEKRAKYDRFGEDWQEGQDFEPAPGQRTMTREEFEAAFGGSGGFSDFFKEMFGGEYQHDFGGGFQGQRHARYQYRGADVRAELHLGIGAALAGGKRSFEVPAQVACPTCGGTGAFQSHVCPTCAGVGLVHERKHIELKIPDGLRDGLELRLKGLGEPGTTGGEPGDLFLTLRLDADDTYALRGDALEIRVSVTPWLAELGGKVDVRTGRGEVTVKVPPHSRTGSRLRLKGQGFGRKDGSTSDAFVRLDLDLPAHLTPRQRELLEELATTTEAHS